MKINAISIAFFSVLLFWLAQPDGSALETGRELDRQAREHFEKKDYNKAVSLWIEILRDDPENEKVQQKIEAVYEIKQKKDLAFQRMKLDYRIARRRLADDDTLEAGIKSGKESIENYKIAYRIDPNDQDLKDMLDDMKRLEIDITAAEKKVRLSKAIREKVKALKTAAVKEMERENYEGALKIWKDILSYIPRDREAEDGVRNCRLAIDNRLKFETIRGFMARGRDHFNFKRYRPARNEFAQALKLDPQNRDARDMIEKIDEILEERKLSDQRARQAEEFYLSGINNLKNNNFDQAQDDFESCLAAVKNYRDARERLASIDRLRKDFMERQKTRKMQEINQIFQEGIISYSRQRYKEAINSFVTVLSIDKNNTQAREYLKRAREARLIEEEERVDENSPYYNLINSLVISGRSLYDKGNYAESKRKWDEILKLFPKNRMANEYIAKCELKINPAATGGSVEKKAAEGREQLRRKEFRAAQMTFEIVKSMNPKYPGIDGFLAEANRGIREGEGAAVNQADQKEIERRYGLAMNYYQAGGLENAKKALAEFQWIVRKDPNNIKAAISVNKIETQLRGGDIDVAQARKKLTPREEELVRKYYYMGISYYAGNDFKRAINEWRKVIAIDPDHIKAKNNIRKVLVFLGQ
ncbi:MAG: tetratricopeptide repeat protein [Spirochaetes bacterium]|jgi:tetratricopeptide (TPR) repeat protein|nr:tetratricopeptide repeat protein [Spirochaetota bacterium]